MLEKDDKNKQVFEIYDLARNKTVPHAILFESENRRSCVNLAVNIAKILMCQKNQSEGACEVCGSCQKINNKSHPDVSFIDAQNNQKTIGVDVIRALRRDAYVVPNESDYKIYIFPDASLITPQAQNAFLKILEEPPKSVVFMIICQNRFDLLNTVLSRTTCFKVYSNEIKIDNDILDDAEEFVDALFAKNELKILEISSKFSKNRNNFIEFLKYSQDLILKKYPQHNCEKSSRNNTNILKILDIIRNCESLIEKNINMSLLPCYMCSNLSLLLKG